jgi:hypothetical protein
MRLALTFFPFPEPLPTQISRFIPARIIRSSLQGHAKCENEERGLRLIIYSSSASDYFMVLISLPVSGKMQPDHTQEPTEERS